MSPIYRPFIAIKKLNEKMWLLGYIFKNSSLVIDDHNGVIDYIVISEELWLLSFEIWIFKHW